jgi:hypothetical protein
MEEQVAHHVDPEERAAATHHNAETAHHASDERTFRIVSALVPNDDSLLHTVSDIGI